MSRKKFLVIVFLIFSLSLYGCSGDVTITDEQEELIAQYAAGVLVKYSYENEWKYTKLYDALYGYHSPTTEYESESAMGNQGEPSTFGTATTNQGTTKQAQTQVKDLSTSLPNALSLTGCSITYSGFTVGNTYPVNPTGIYVPAETDRVVVGVEFNVVNNTQAVINANTSSAGVLMKLNISGNNYMSYATLLKNSLLTLNNVSLNPGENYTAVVLFQVPKDLETSISGKTVTAVQNSQTLGSIELK